MAEYIERDAAINAVFEAYADGRSAYSALEAIPAADVVEVVLCRKCQSYNKPRLGFCETHLVRTHGDDFCSYGKKREES